MKTLKKIYDGIVEVEGWIAVVALVAAIVLNAYEILQRNLWGNSFTGNQCTLNVMVRNARSPESSE